MILYRLADQLDDQPSSSLPLPRTGSAFLGPLPAGPSSRRTSVISSADSDHPLYLATRSSYLSLNPDSKYPICAPSNSTQTHHYGGLIAYEYDPSLDQLGPPDEEDLLHDPKHNSRPYSHTSSSSRSRFPWRGLSNIGLLVFLVLGLLTLFIFYPVYSYYRDYDFNNAISANVRINATGQAPLLFHMPDMIDPATPGSARTRTGYDGIAYELVFSDEFELDGRSFSPGDDPYWEAVDIWYGSTMDMEWYDPGQITTRNGSLVITMDSADTLQPHTTPGSTAPFTLAENHNLTYRSGMLQSWNKFCFTSGYIEVSVVLPGPNENTQGYWPGAWTMGNLGRPGFAATSSGTWPYTYDSCDTGTFPNQTYSNHSGPPAALHSDASRDKYNNELSWLPGQRLSACSCPGSDHPGPSTDKGRGAPEIDIFEVEKDKINPTGQVASQSAQFAPFTHDYLYSNQTNDQYRIFDEDVSRPNPYRGSALQQAVSTLGTLPTDMFQGSGAVYRTMGFEYLANPKNRSEGFITWQIDGKPTYRLGAGAVGPDPDTQISARLIPEEPMSIVLNLGISQNWQNIDLSTMIFPAELKFDYVRVYQRKGHINVGCDPKDYPTKKYIEDHIEAYTNANKTTWDWPIPTNSLLAGGC